MDWPADKIERRKVDALIPYARNARTHSDEQVAQDMTVYHQPGLDMSDAVKLPGFMLRYVYFLDKSAKANLAVPILPFSKIDEMGASMYLGKAREKQAMASFPEVQRQGSTDLHAPNLEGSGETFSPLLADAS